MVVMNLKAACLGVTCSVVKEGWFPATSTMVSRVAVGPHFL